VRRANLAGLLELLLLLLLGDCSGRRIAATRCCAARMVFGHVQLELFGVGVGGGLPARSLVDKVEVVGEVLAVAVADLPVGRQAGLFLVVEGSRVSTRNMHRFNHCRLVSLSELGLDLRGSRQT
jgi:hypothetical protein